MKIQIREPYTDRRCKNSFLTTEYSEEDPLGYASYLIDLLKWLKNQ